MALGTAAALGLGAGAGVLGSQLLGGGGSGSGGGGGTQQVSKLLPEQEELLQRLIREVTPSIGQPGRVPGQEFAPLGPGPIQQQAFGLAGGAGLDAFQQSIQPFSGQQFAQQVGGPLSQFAQQQFQQETIPAIAGAVGFGGGARSSGFQDILSREGRNLQLGLNAQLAPLAFGAQQGALGRQFQAPQGIGGLLNIGAAQQAFPAEQRRFGLEQFFAADPSRNPALALLGPALGTSAFDTAVFQGFRQPGLAESLLPALGTAAGGFLSNPNAFG